MKRGLFMLAAALCGAALVISCAKKEGARAGGAAAKTYTLKMSTQLADTSPMVRGFKAWAEAVKTKSGGRVEIQVYPSAQMGSDEDVIEQAMQGVNVAVLTDGGRMANYVKDIGIIGMPYLVNDYAELRAITESATFASWDPLFAAEGIHILAYNWYDGPRNFYTNTPVSKPADLNGLRIRTPGAPVWARSVASLGATPIAMGWNDSYNALQSKSIDGVEVQTTSAYPAKLWEVTKYAARTEHFHLANFIMVGTKWWNTLPEDLREIVEGECKAQAAANAELVLKTAAEWEEEMAAKGLVINAVDKTPFIEASGAAYEELGFSALRDKLFAEIGKN